MTDITVIERVINETGKIQSAIFGYTTLYIFTPNYSSPYYVSIEMYDPEWRDSETEVYQEIFDKLKDTIWEIVSLQEKENG